MSSHQDDRRKSAGNKPSKAQQPAQAEPAGAVAMGATAEDVSEAAANSAEAGAEGHASIDESGARAGVEGHLDVGGVEASAGAEGGVGWDDGVEASGGVGAGGSWTVGGTDIVEGGVSAEGEVHVDPEGAGQSAEGEFTMPTTAGGVGTSAWGEAETEVDWSDGVEVSQGLAGGGSQEAGGFKLHEEFSAEQSAHVDSKGAGVEGSAGASAGIWPAGAEASAKGGVGVTWDDGVTGSAGASLGGSAGVLGIDQSVDSSSEIHGHVDEGGVSGGASVEQGSRGIIDSGTGHSVEGSLTWDSGVDASLGETSTVMGGFGGADQSATVDTSLEAGVGLEGASAGFDNSVGTDGVLGEASIDTGMGAGVTWDSGIEASGHGQVGAEADVLGVSGSGELSAEQTVSVGGEGVAAEGGLHADVGGGALGAAGDATASVGIGPGGVSAEAGIGGEQHLGGATMGGEAEGHVDLGTGGLDVGASGTTTTGLGGDTEVTVGAEAEAGIGGGNVHASTGGGVEGVAEAGVAGSVGLGGAEVKGSAEVFGKDVSAGVSTRDVERAVDSAADSADDAWSAATTAADDAGDAAGDAWDAAEDAADDAEDAVEDTGEAIGEGAEDVGESLGF